MYWYRKFAQIVFFFCFSVPFLTQTCGQFAVFERLKTNWKMLNAHCCWYTLLVGWLHELSVLKLKIFCSFFHELLGNLTVHLYTLYIY
jgi:hypothetical protein